MAHSNNSNQQIGFVVNQKFLSFVIAFFTIIAMMASGVSIINNYSFKIEQLERQNALLVTQITGLNKRLDILSENIVELKISLNRIDDRTSGDF